MHKNELQINEQLVRTLLEEQAPEYLIEGVQKIDKQGTVNALFRLGNRYCARLPRVADWAQSTLNEWNILDKIRGKTIIAIPRPVFLGRPSDRYPLHWAVYEWLNGEDYSETAVRSEWHEAEKLAAFVKQLHSLPLDPSFPKAGRAPLADLHDLSIRAIRQAAPYLNTTKATRAWETLTAAPGWDGNPVLIHADLLRTNLLVSKGEISTVLDFGSAGIGDPAFDLSPAWAVFNASGREKYLREFDQIDRLYTRAMAYALHQALLIIPYYYKSYNYFSRLALRTVEQIVAELGL